MKTTLFSLLALVLGFAASPAFAIDQVTLNNGQVVEGTVLNDVPNLYVDIRLVNGDTKRFQKTEVASVDRDVPSRKDREQFGNQSLGFVAVNLGGQYNLNSAPSGVSKTVLFDYGIKVGVVTGQMGDSKVALALSFDRSTQSVTNAITAYYNDLNLQFLFTRIGNSGFYFGPNVGLAITGLSYDSNVVTNSSSSTDFEAGAGLGYEVYLSDGFSIGPDVRYEHAFIANAAGNMIKFSLQGTIHF